MLSSNKASSKVCNWKWRIFCLKHCSFSNISIQLIAIDWSECRIINFFRATKFTGYYKNNGLYTVFSPGSYTDTICRKENNFLTISSEPHPYLWHSKSFFHSAKFNRYRCAFRIYLSRFLLVVRLQAKLVYMSKGTQSDWLR